MIVVSGTAAVVLIILGIVIWIAETTGKARRLAAQRAKNRELRSQAAAAAAPKAPAVPGQGTASGDSGTQPPAMPYGI